MHHLNIGTIIASPMFYPSEPLAIIHATTLQIGDVVGGRKGILLSDVGGEVQFTDFSLLQSIPTLGNYSAFDLFATNRLNKVNTILGSERDVLQGISLQNKVIWAYINNVEGEGEFVTDGAIDKALTCKLLEEVSYEDALEYLIQRCVPGNGMDLQIQKYKEQLGELGKVQELVYQVKSRAEGTMIAFDPKDFLGKPKKGLQTSVQKGGFVGGTIPQGI